MPRRKKRDISEGGITVENNSGVKPEPLFVSVPRSGTHWLQACMLEAFDGDYVPRKDMPQVISRNPLVVSWSSFEEKKGAKILWRQTHDQFQAITTSSPLGSIFLLRNPVDMVYSAIRASGQRNIDSIEENDVSDWAFVFKNLFDKWVVNEKAGLIITYEQIQKDHFEVMRSIAEFWKLDFDEEKVRFAISAMSKGNILSNEKGQSHSKEMLAEEYSLMRERFREKYSSKIFEIVVDAKNEEKIREFYPSLFKYDSRA